MLSPVDCRIPLENPAAVRNSNEWDRMFCRISRNIVWGTGIRWPSQLADCNDQLVADRMQQPNYHEGRRDTITVLETYAISNVFFIFSGGLQNRVSYNDAHKYIRQEFHNVALLICESKRFVYERAEPITTKCRIAYTSILYILLGICYGMETLCKTGTQWRPIYISDISQCEYAWTWTIFSICC